MRGLKFAQLSEYTIVGRKLPSKEVKNPPLFKMTIFAPNTVVAKSRFWYFLSQLKKIKKSQGEVVSITKACAIQPCPAQFTHLSPQEDNKTPFTIKNFAVWCVIFF